ncbi:MAG: alpha/beta hydrolase [Epsilonproteobacteria bacterium]|nr:alpha/beta hydrolase [Campylobacterota bacterium]
MLEKNVSLISDKIKLDGSFYLPDAGENSTKPIVIVCSGFTGMKEIHPARFARFLTRQDNTVFGFDYRGFGKSEGTKNKVLLEEQIRDIANVVSYVKNIYTERKIVLAGWGMSGGMILESAKLVTNLIDGLICMNGFYNSIRVQKALRGEEGFKKYKKWLAKQRVKNVNGKGKEDFDPFDIYPLDAISRKYVFEELVKTEGYGIRSNFDFADSLMLFNCEDDLRHLLNIPILIAHGSENKLHPVTEAQSIFEKYPNEDKELFLLEGGGHTEWMLDTDPKFIKFASKLASWIERF